MTRFAAALGVLSLSLGAAGPAFAYDLDEPAFGVMTPAVMPDGGSALVIGLGYPNMQLAYRHGIPSAEVGVEGDLDLLRYTLRGLATLRTPLVLSEPWTLGFDLKVGAFRTYRTREADPSVVPSGGLALVVGTTLSWKSDWPVAFYLRVWTPLEAPFTEGGGTRAMIMMGGGIEFTVAESTFISLNGAAGPEFRQGLSTLTAAEGALGFGYRFF